MVSTLKIGKRHFLKAGSRIIPIGHITDIEINNPNGVSIYRENRPTLFFGGETAEAQPEQLLQIEFHDQDGFVIRTFKVGLADSIAEITKFVTLHGTDPDENGKGAAPGSITFRPI